MDATNCGFVLAHVFLAFLTEVTGGIVSLQPHHGGLACNAQYPASSQTCLKARQPAKIGEAYVAAAGPPKGQVNMSRQC